jgi:GNAT superfamily N-acetyltransferase
MGLYLRKAGEDELQTILDILNAGTRNKIRRGDLAWGMSDHNPEAIKTMVTEGLFYLAFNDSTPVGTLALAWQDIHMWGNQPTDAGYVQRFAVAPGYNGQNIGGQILELAIEEVREHGRQYLRIAVPSGNMKLRTYYENHGFVRADNTVIPPIHPAYAAAYYERSINGSSQVLSQKKTGLFTKLRSSKLFRESE